MADKLQTLYLIDSHALLYRAYHAIRPGTMMAADRKTPTNALFIPKRDTTLLTAFDQYDGGIYYREPIRKTFMGAASYVTGSHNIKVGIQYGYGYFWRQRRMAADSLQLYRAGVPSQVIIYNTPRAARAT